MPLLVVMFSGAFALALVLTYLVRGWATRVGLVDAPDGERRLHFQPVPRVGGIAVYLAMALVALGGLLAPHALVPTPGMQRALVVLIAGSGAVFLIGLWDDVRGLAARPKFVLEVVLATAVFAAGVRLRGIGLAHGGYWVFPYGLSWLLTTVWIVGVTNAFNLIDGSDGVAAGAAVFASGSLAVVLLLGGNMLGAAVALTVVGATLGFLFYNFPPATIFLGDSGSLTIGFVLAMLGVITAQATPTALAVGIPVVSFGLPILDTSLAVVRRFLRRERIFAPDRGHIHHRLRDLGHSPRRVALLMMLGSAAFALLSLLLVSPHGAATGTAYLVAGAIVLVAVQRLNIPELLELRRVVERGFMQRSVIATNVRLREAARELHGAGSVDGIFRALAGAFHAAHFVRAELWLGQDLPGEPEANGRIERVDGGVLWRWSARGPNGVSSPEAPEDAWELRLPLRDPQGQLTGRLSLWHALSERHLLPDVRLILLELGPEFHAAVLRLAHPEGRSVHAHAQDGAPAPALLGRPRRGQNLRRRGA